MEINTEKEIVKVLQEATISIKLSKKEAGVLAAIVGNVEKHKDLNIEFLYKNLRDFVGYSEFNELYSDLYKGILLLDK